MVTVDVNTEDPREHWKYLSVLPNDVAIDFGCGRWEDVEPRDPSWPTTPEYIKSLGARRVFAFDYNPEEIRWFNNRFQYDSSYVFSCTDLSNHKVMEEIFRNVKPNVVKCDIEKNEMHLLNVHEDLFKTVKSYGIETHRRWIFEAFMNEFPKRGYVVTTVVNLVHANPMKVIFAERI